MQHFELTSIGSVEPNKNYSQKNFDRLEGNLQKKLIKNMFCFPFSVWCVTLCV
jgi:hypothetical protein